MPLAIQSMQPTVIPVFREGGSDRGRLMLNHTHKYVVTHVWECLCGVVGVDRDTVVRHERHQQGAFVAKTRIATLAESRAPRL